MSHEKLIAHISAFLKERDEATRDDERDDDERKASAQCIARVVFKALEEPSEEMLETVVPEPEHLYPYRDEKYKVLMKAAVASARLTALSRWREMIAVSPLATKESGE